mmetsp:Transcript_5376/g.9027  ORF Transcript_5376/g.9027 Transcript_5376/m.9027 type:complete len:88 (+) Transcript_5376:215-478(+)
MTQATGWNFTREVKGPQSLDYVGQILDWTQKGPLRKPEIYKVIDCIMLVNQQKQEVRKGKLEEGELLKAENTILNLLAFASHHKFQS